jgi:polyphosphate kinase
VEVIFPIKSKIIGNFILNNILKLQLADNVNARILDSEGNYHPVQRDENDEVIDSQDLQIRAASDLVSWEPMRIKIGKF